MKYQRKTREKWLSDAFIGLALISGSIFGAAYNKFINGETYAYELKTIEVEIDKLVYEHPDTVEGMITMVFKDDAPLMIEVARCESGLSPTARNKVSTATGVFQIMSSIHGVSRDRLENPMVNILVAKELFDASGTNPWNASIHCWGSK